MNIQFSSDKIKTESYFMFPMNLGIAVWFITYIKARISPIRFNTIYKCLL